MSSTDYPLQDEIWCELIADPQQLARRPALFLDRDGVIVEEVDYLHRVDDVALVPGAAEIIRAANAAHVPVIIVTNQGGIGRGYFDWAAFHDVQTHMRDMLRRQGAEVDAIFACPFHEKGIGAYLHDRHPDRKPQPGMLMRAGAALSIDLRGSWIIGDKLSDLEAGHAAGLAGGVLVRTGHGPSQDEQALRTRTPDFDVRVSDSIADTQWLIMRLAQLVAKQLHH